jgi:EpsI family protein
MSDRLKALAPVLLAAQCLLALWAVKAEHPPHAPRPDSFPSTFGKWRRVAVMPASLDEQKLLNAGALVDWSFVQESSPVTLNLLIAWYPSQRAADPFIHRPDVCLPGNGWSIASDRRLVISTVSDAIAATQYVISKGGERQVVLYWYQTHYRAAADLWELKLGMALDVFRSRRSDVALVRLSTHSSGDIVAASQLDFAFARDLAPFIHEWFPL